MWSIQETSGSYKYKVMTSSLLKFGSCLLKPMGISQRLVFAAVKLFRVTHSSKGQAVMGMVVPLMLPVKSILPRNRTDGSRVRDCYELLEMVNSGHDQKTISK
jgi:hypothetical protein